MSASSTDAASPASAQAAPAQGKTARISRPKIYAGIGSRKTPREILDLFEEVAYRLGLRGFRSRTGGADGADEAFENGARRALAEGFGELELFLPWQGFNGRTSIHCRPPQLAMDIAATLHPGWKNLGPGPRKLMARNAQQIMGPTLDLPSSFVLCWTPDGCVDASTRSRTTGGTGQAIAHAAGLGIPVYNAQRPEHLERIHRFMGQVEGQQIGEAAQEGRAASGQNGADSGEKRGPLRI